MTIQSLTNPATGSSLSQSGTVQPRLHEAAVQFESVLLKDLLEPLSKACSFANDGSEDQAGALQSFAVDAVASSMARSGALGFARQIEQTLSRAAAQHFSQTALKS